MKTLWAFVAGAVCVGGLCAASGSQKEWDVYSVRAGLLSDGPSEKLPYDLPSGSEPIGSHVIADGVLNRVYIVYRVPKK